MIRLAISVEGPTEQEFVKNVLARHLRVNGVEAQPFSLNGNVTVVRLASDMAKLIWNYDRVTSLVDFYGFRDKNTSSPEELERHIHATVDSAVKRSWDQSHVIPYVQQHEFEGLLFSDVTAFADAMLVPDSCVAELQDIRSRFATPEDINDSSDTVPSKRISKVIPRYRKVVDGSLIASATGLDRIRAECPRFDSWLKRLESLGT